MSRMVKSGSTNEAQKRHRHRGLSERFKEWFNKPGKLCRLTSECGLCRSARALCAATLEPKSIICGKLSELVPSQICAKRRTLAISIHENRQSRARLQNSAGACRCVAARDSGHTGRRTGVFEPAERHSSAQRQSWQVTAASCSTACAEIV